MMCFGKFEHFAFDLEFGHVLERLFRRSDLVIEVESVGDQAFAVRADEDGAQRRNRTVRAIAATFSFFMPSRRSTKASVAHLVRRQIVGLVEIGRVDLRAGDVGFDLQRLVALGDGAATSSGSRTMYWPLSIS